MTPKGVARVLAIFFFAGIAAGECSPYVNDYYFHSVNYRKPARTIIPELEKAAHYISKAYFIFFPSHYTPLSQTTTGKAQSTTGEENGDSLEKTGEQTQNRFTVSGQYVHFRNSMTPILEKIDPSSPILGLAAKGSNYPLLRKGEQWCSILYKDKEGWVDRSNVDIVDAPTSITFISEFFLVIAIIVSVGLILAVFYFIHSRTNKIKAEWFTPKNKKVKIVLIAKAETKVQRVFTNNITTLEKCFSEIGFDVRKAGDSESANKLIHQFVPDAIIVDWHIGKNVQYVMEQILVSKSFTNSIFVLFYNTPDTATVTKSVIIPNAHYLGVSFTDRELFHIVTPIIITGEHKHTIRKSIETSALQGDLSECNLVDVFQFIEIGSKTGCLLIEDDEPSGIIYFHNGIIIYAASKNTIGRKAVFTILNLQSGQFYFVHGKDPKSTNCSVHIEEILLEWAKEKDEGSRDRLR